MSEPAPPYGPPLSDLEREVLDEVMRLARDATERAGKALASRVTRCAWCEVERPLRELEVDPDEGDVVCIDVDRCCASVTRKRKPKGGADGDKTN